MRKFLHRLWREEHGVLSFEWVTLTTLVVVGAVSGMAAIRDAVNDEMGDLTEAMTSLNQSYQIQPPLMISVHTPGGQGGGNFSGRWNEFRGSSGRFGGSSPYSPGVYAAFRSGGGDGVSGAAGSMFSDRSSHVERSREELPEDGKKPLDEMPDPT